MTNTYFDTSHPAFIKWLTVAQKIVDNHNQSHGYSNSILEYRQGSRYIKVMCRDLNNNGRHVWAFIDRSNGDVLKPASLNAPAKHARGNLFDETLGLSQLGPYGPAYLR